MKFSPKKSLAALAITCGVVGLRAELTKWAENMEAGSRLESVFFRTVLLPSGSVPVRRPPKETRPELSKLIAAAPADAELYSLRALEAEQQLDFTSAEADWKKYVEAASDKGAARLALADYYHRRLQSREEFDALALAAREPAPDPEKLLSVSQQRPWKTYERLIRLVDGQRLDPALGATQFSIWILSGPPNPELHVRFFRYAMDHQRFDFAGQVIDAYTKAFPKEEDFPIEARAELAAKLGPPAQAMAVYESSFRPLWSPRLVSQYFELLKRTNSLRVYLEKARSGVAANPVDLGSAARLFYYWQQQNNLPQAERALAEFRQRKDTRQSPWTAEELLTLARLFEISHNYDEAARNYYALYSVPGSDAPMAETALGSLARLLLTAPEQPIHLGSGNLSLYRDVAAMDPHPGFLNGVFSLLLNEADPPNRYAIEEQNAGSYFRRARAVELVGLFESRFPNSLARPDLRERVIEAYAIHGSTDGVIRSGTKFLADFPDAANRMAVALRMADAYARRNQTREEFATYDALLAELGKRASGVPIGALPVAAPRPPGQAAAPQYDLLRSPDYARVLDRYVARLVSMKRVRDALVLYRREIDRNVSDPGLYDMLAAFLEQNRLGTEIEQVYQRAISQFPDHTWEHKLARWYLRQRRQADVARVTRDVVKIFYGTELDNYFREIVNPAAPVGPALYLQLNVYAHQRFPHHLSFVRNLLTAYTAPTTRDDSAYEVLLRRHWYDAEDLRTRFFERLSRTGRLDAELSVVRTSNPAATAARWGDAMEQNPAAVRMLAEGEAWRGHFEAAAPMFLALETGFPADSVIGRRTAALYRSLGTDTGIAVEEKLTQANPRDRDAFTRLGEMEAERDRFDRASTRWTRLIEIEPAKPDSYLEAATVFWDYYRFDDALRIIDEGRKRLANPSLFAYEAGAIHENRRTYDAAIREYARGALAQPGSNAEQRLLSLARRPALRAQIEQLTDNLVSGRNPQAGAFVLRVALLHSQNRRDDLEKFLLDLAARTDTPETLASVENAGRIDGLPKVQQAAIDRQIALATDPVERMRLRLALARFHEGQGQTTQGAQVIDTLYRENPTILGVVRAAVDYHWRNKSTKRSVDVLEEAAARAAAGYRDQLTLEAARKATESGDYPRARAFATKVLQSDPYRAEYVALMADTYARQGDDRGLRTFYDGKIRDLGAAHRSDDAAALRRAVIPVLTRMKDFSAGIDQYIELVNRYAEDDSLAREAALYASANGVARKLHDYYVKAGADSPKDFRWPMVLARIETSTQDFPAAIASYTRAAGVRPDRADLLMARLNLEERLLRFDEAAATSEKLYELTYRNPQWMDRLAELRARQGRNADAVAALNKAWIEGRPDNAQNFINVAQRLEAWAMLAEARKFAEEALKRSADDSLPVYTRILMRQREIDAALVKLAAAKDPAAAVGQAGAVVQRDYSSAEKLRFAAAIEKQARRLALAESAGLVDLQSKWIYERLMAAPTAADAPARKQRLIELQRSRLKFDELGAQLEAYDRALAAGAQHADELTEAAACYRATGNTAAELRVLQLQHGRSPLDGALLDRYCQLLIAQPPRAVAAIGRESRAGAANAVINYVVLHANAAVTQQAIAARGQKTGPLWAQAYTGLAGLYNASNAAPVRAAFTGLLGDMTIGSRIGKPVDRDQQLAGDLWFYYAGRYGEYLDAIKQPGAEDYLPAMVESTPGRSDAYFALAEYYRDSGGAGSATADYRNALDLAPSRADVHDRLAGIAAQAGQSDQAVQEWKLALAAFTGMMNRAHVPQKFWGDLAGTLHHIGEAKMLDPLRDDIEKLLRLYIRRNGAFQSETLMEGVLAVAVDPSAGVTWIADLSRSAADPVQFLSVIIDRPWMPEPQKDILFRRIVESAQAQVAQSFGEHQSNAQSQMWTWQIAWANYLLGRKENVRAAQIVASFPVDARKQRVGEIISLEIRSAARARTLPPQLARYEEPLPVDQLRNAATELIKDGDAAAARRILEFVYNHQLNAGDLSASTFLGLAEIRLQENDVSGAMILLRRMTLVSGEAFSTLDPAAAMLEKTGHPAEAAEFLNALAKAEPWNADARERLAAAQGSTAALASVAKSADAPYATRLAAALSIRKLKGEPLTAVDPELVTLSSQTPLAESEVSHPYYAVPRLEAAQLVGEAPLRERLLSAAVAIDPRPLPPKLALFRAAIDAHHDALAVAVARQLMPTFPEETEFTPWVADSFLNSWTPGDRATVARGLGEAHQRLGNMRAAAVYFQIAQQIEPADRIRRALDAVRAQIDTMTKNDQRRPVVSDNLDQDRLVRTKVGPR